MAPRAFHWTENRTTNSCQCPGVDSSTKCFKCLACTCFGWSPLSCRRFHLRFPRIVFGRALLFLVGRKLALGSAAPPSRISCKTAPQKSRVKRERMAVRRSLGEEANMGEWKDLTFRKLPARLRYIITIIIHRTSCLVVDYMLPYCSELMLSEPSSHTRKCCVHSPLRRAFFSQSSMEQILPPPCLMQ